MAGSRSPTREALADQIRAISRVGGDQNSEHYRAATLQAFLRSRDALTDAEVRTVLELGDIDPDAAFRPSFVHELIRGAGLTDEQFELVASHSSDPPFQRVVIRLRVLRRLAAGASLADIFDDAMATGDSQLHAVLLERADLTTAQVATLADKGGNRGIRNRAMQLARSRRFARTSQPQ